MVLAPLESHYLCSDSTLGGTGMPPSEPGRCHVPDQALAPTWSSAHAATLLLPQDLRWHFWASSLSCFPVLQGPEMGHRVQAAENSDSTCKNSMWFPWNEKEETKLQAEAVWGQPWVQNNCGGSQQLAAPEHCLFIFQAARRWLLPRSAAGHSSQSETGSPVPAWCRETFVCSLPEASSDTGSVSLMGCLIQDITTVRVFLVDSWTALAHVRGYNAATLKFFSVT